MKSRRGPANDSVWTGRIAYLLALEARSKSPSWDDPLDAILHGQDEQSSRIDVGLAFEPIAIQSARW